MMRLILSLSSYIKVNLKLRRGNDSNKVSIRTLSSLEDAFDKNEKYYEWLKNSLVNNINDFHQIFSKEQD